MKFESKYNLSVFGPKGIIRFMSGKYETDDKEEIEVLNKCDQCSSVEVVEKENLLPEDLTDDKDALEKIGDGLGLEVDKRKSVENIRKDIKAKRAE